MRGDLFEVVCGQLFATRCPDPPSLVFQRLRRANPAPYGALINLGEGEFLRLGVAGNVRARRGQAHRDLPDLRHDRARRATRSRTPSASANCSTRPRTRAS